MELIGRFGTQIAMAIGVGGMGEVYRATDTKLKRDVTIVAKFDRSNGETR